MKFFVCRCVDANLMKKFALVYDQNGKALQEVADAESSNETEFQWALRVRNIDLLKQLLNGVNSNYLITNDKQNRSPFHIACEQGHNDIVEIIINNLGKIAIDINGNDSKQLTGMIYIALQ